MGVVLAAAGVLSVSEAEGVLAVAAGVAASAVCSLAVAAGVAAAAAAGVADCL
jgi:hypothetical protein